MARKKKDGRFINYYIDRGIYERLEQYAQDKTQPVTAALEQILEEYLSRYELEVAQTERYCPHCHILVHGIRCPNCGKGGLALPRSEDYCFLTEREILWAGMLADALCNENIPCVTQNTMGAGLTAKAGSLMETVRFFVPYEFFVQAKTLEEGLFPSIQ